MRRFGLITAILATLAVGCVDDDLSLVILQNQVAGPDCVIDATPTSAFRGRGIIDVQASGGYLFTPVVKNYAVTGGAVTEAQRLIQIEGADIELELPDGLDPGGVPIQFSSRFSGTVEPDGGTTSFSFVLLPKELLDALAGQLAADGSQIVSVKTTVSIFGRMAGSDIKSDPYIYWVDVCNGCMRQNVGSCTDLPAGFTPLTGGECNLLQDVPLECCTSSTDTLVCPATPEAPPA